jgi:hypothetical protein
LKKQLFFGLVFSDELESSNSLAQFFAFCRCQYDESPKAYTLDKTANHRKQTFEFESFGICLEVPGNFYQCGVY